MASGGNASGNGMSVVVIGAGAVGSSIAFRLAERGARVRLIDKAEPAAGTSSRSFAWANSNQKTPRDYFELNYAGLRLHRALAQELGSAPWFHPSGNVIFATDPDDIEKLEQRVARLREWGYAAEWQDAAGVRSQLEPLIAFPRDDLPVAYFPEEGWVDAPQLARAMVELARRHGATTIFRHAVTGIDQSGGKVSGVRLDDGRTLACDVVVNAAGTAADQIARMLDLPLPLAPTPGLLVRVYVGNPPITRILHGPGVNIRPDGPGHLLLGHEDIDARLGERRQIDVAANDPLCRELFARAQRILPLENARIASARIGVRPYPADGHSCVGPVSARPGYFEAVTHSGVTLGPLLGKLLSAEILTGEVDPLLAPFRPDRFPRG